LVQPPFHGFYDQAKIKVALPERPSLTFATLATPLVQRGHEVSILDLNQESQPRKALEASLQDFRPDFVGITCSTPLYFEAKDIAAIVKDHSRDTGVIFGGVHPSSFPQETLADTRADFVCVGEGDYTLLDIVEGKAPEAIPNLLYRLDGRTVSVPTKQFIKDMDALPYPSWHLFDLKRYHTPRLTARKNPVGPMETSRGCVFGCIYCNKNIFGRTFRAKSPQRVVGEMEHMLAVGFQEIVILDDGFTTNLKRAKEICRLIVEKGLKFPWNLQNGIRVDTVDQEFMELAREAGCYSITFGVESGDQAILDNVGKGIKLDEVRQAFRWAREAGLETLAYFMIGLPGETEESMRRTIDFCRELEPTYAKVGILVPLPGTPLFSSFDKLGHIKSKDWALYNQHNPEGVYDHPNLSWEALHRHYDLFYRRFYLRPGYIWKVLKRDMFSANVFYDAIYFLRTRW